MRVELNPPRTARTVGASYILEAVDEKEIKLPVKCTTLETADTPDGPMVVAVDLPSGIAANEGLAPSEKETTEQVEQMSRHDWFTLGAMVGLIASGHSERDIVWNARKYADKAVE
jgi:hypothetical protein